MRSLLPPPPLPSPAQLVQLAQPYAPAQARNACEIKQQQVVGLLGILSNLCSSAGGYWLLALTSWASLLVFTVMVRPEAPFRAHSSLPPWLTPAHHSPEVG